MLEELARAQGKQLIEWSIHRGLRHASGRAADLEAVKDPVKALDAIGKLAEPSLVITSLFELPHLLEVALSARPTVSASAMPSSTRATSPMRTV